MKRLKPLNRRLKIVLLLAVSQAACLAVGIWVQYRLVLVLADWDESSAPVPVEVADFPGASDAGERSVSTETVRAAMVTSLSVTFFWIARARAALNAPRPAR